MSTAPELEPDAVEPRSKPPFLRRVRIRNYKSIAFCDVALEPLTILVGRNASGKSNVLNALAFLRDLLAGGAQEATRKHGGHDAIVWRDAEHPVVTIEVECGYLASPPQAGWSFKVNDPWTGMLSVDIEFVKDAPPRIIREYVRLAQSSDSPWAAYTVSGGDVAWGGVVYSFVPKTWNHPDRLLLALLPISPFEELFDGIHDVRDYSFHPAAIRTPQRPAAGEFLQRDGRNLASVVREIAAVEPWAVGRISQFLEVIAPGIRYEDVAAIGGHEITRFRVNSDSPGTPSVFDAGSMSDGTLRAFAALVSVYQQVRGHGSPHLVAVEEPETSLHPAAMNALVGALDEATLRTQILLTTHSGEMLDNPTIRPENVRVVQMIDGRSVIAPVDEASVEIVRRNLNTLGGLERENQLQPDDDDRERQAALSHSPNGAPR